MTTESVDDEWERSEKALKQLQIEPKIQDHALFFPNDNNPDDGGQEGQINTALIDALQNPRERMNVLKYEDRILRFVNSSDSFLDVPPISNSYQRLLIYKVAERFGLQHNPSETSNELGDRGIIFYKTQVTAIPSILLINYKGEELKMESAVSTSSLPNTSKGPKIVVMQRRNTKPSTSNQKNNSSEKNQTSASEREKAYAAARARIFGEDAPPEAGSPTPSPPGVKSIPDISSKPQSQETSIRGKPENGVPVQSRVTQSSSPAQGEIDSEQTQKKKVVDAGNWKEKKVLLRDKQAERFDPDFARFSSGPPIPIPYQSPSPTLNASAPSFQSSIPPVYPNVVLHHPPTNIAPALSSTPITPTMHNWNTTTHMNMMPVQWDTHPSPQPSFTAYDYQRPGPPYQPNYALPSNIPVAPGLPDHLTNSKSSSHHTQMQSSYNKDFPPLA